MTGLFAVCFWISDANNIIFCVFVCVSDPVFPREAQYFTLTDKTLSVW